MSATRRGGGTSPPEDCSFCTTYPYAARPDRRAMAAKAPVVQGSDPRLMKFDKTGRFLASVSLAHPTGPFATTHTVVISPAGELWVGDRNAKKIVVFDRNLKKLREIDMNYLTCGLYVDAKSGLWMSAGMNGKIGSPPTARLMFPPTISMLSRTISASSRCGR